MDWKTRRRVRVGACRRPAEVWARALVVVAAVAVGVAAGLWLRPGEVLVRWTDPGDGIALSLAETAGVAAPGPVAAAPPPERQVILRPPPASVFEAVPVSRTDFERTTSHLEREPQPDTGAPWDPARLVEWVVPPGHRSDLHGPLRVEYSMDVELTRRIHELLRQGRVAQGHVLVMEPSSGRLLAYASTDPAAFPASRPYPAASLIKVVTAAAALDEAPEEARRPCRYRGSPYRLTPSRVRRPSSGNEMSLERSLATSNNQCFAQLAVNALGGAAMLSAIERFGWLSPPAPGHDAGLATVGDDDYDLGRLGCGLAGCRITPLHAVQLAGSLARGELVEPWWVQRVVDVRGNSLPLPGRPPPRRIMRESLARELREMLVRTTTRGTARSAFRDRRGRARLGEIRVAGKTGNLSGEEPAGRYEWFVGVAPAEAPRVAVAVLQLQSDLWWVRSSELGADVLRTIFCENRSCRASLASRFTSGESQLSPEPPSEPRLGG